jgi:hypothetical protein
VVSEYPLRGGSVSTVVRGGDTVRRQPGRRFVRELLGFLERSGWGGAPRFLGVDERGRDRCWRGIQAGAEAGDPAMVRLRDDGAVREVRAAFEWVAAHRSELEVS